MGLAASQARFLGLTARKSNVEYKGQQINQARTALSNEVLGLYNEYNNLNVPTPPIVNDYKKTSYALDSTAQNYEISSFTKIPDGENKGYYNVTLSCDEKVAKAYTYTAKDSVITAEKSGNSYSYLNFQFGTESYSYIEGDEQTSTITKITSDYSKYPGLSTIMAAQGLTSGTFYSYTKNGISYYTSEDDLNSTSFETKDGKSVYYGDFTFDYQGEQDKTKNVNAIAALTQDDSGRLSAIQVITSDDSDLVGQVYSITTNTKDDEKAYNDAMNKYNYEKQVYEREVEKINQKTETLQKEDRSLELQLNQLDTEQKAISTELESVKKVIQDTMDKVFKTFEG